MITDEILIRVKPSCYEVLVPHTDPAIPDMDKILLRFDNHHQLLVWLGYRLERSPTEVSIRHAGGSQP